MLQFKTISYIILILSDIRTSEVIVVGQEIGRFGKNFYKVSGDYIDRLKKQDFLFRAYDLNTVIRHLRNGTEGAGFKENGKIPVQLSIWDDFFMQLTNTRNKNLWSTLPYTTEYILAVNQACAVEELRIVSSTVKASSIPSNLKKLNLTSTRITDGTLSSIIRRNPILEDLILIRSGDIYISDLSFTSQLRSINFKDLSVHYSSNVNLHQIKHVKFHDGTFIDPRVLKEFSEVFNGLESIALDQTYFDILKKSLLEIQNLNWITIWKLNVALLNRETILENILVEGVVNDKLTAPVELVKINGVWNLITFDHAKTPKYLNF